MGLIVTYFYENLIIPNGIYTIVAIIGLFWAGFQIFQDQECKINPAKEKDSLTLNRFCKFLPFETVKYIREHDFRGIFRNDFVKVLDRFLEESKNPDFIFLDAKLESYRITIVSFTNDFLHLVTLNSFIENATNGEESKIPQSHEFHDPQKWYVITNQIDKLTDDIFENYKLLIQTAKKTI